MNLIYNKDLANRFVSDYKLPIQLTDEKYFFYFLDLYEKEFKSLTKYANLCNLIKNRFNNNPNLFWMNIIKFGILLSRQLKTAKHIKSLIQWI